MTCDSAGIRAYCVLSGGLRPGGMNMSETNFAKQAGRVLVVDDTSDNLQLLTSILTRHGYSVDTAANGEQALKLLGTVLPDLILLDIRMPVMDGYEVCRRLKSDEDTRAIPVIFISALEDEGDKVKGFQLGAVDYVTKPFQPEEVLERVKAHLGAREWTLQLEREVRKRTEELAAANHRLKQELSERRRAEEALRRLNEDLEERVRERTRELARSRDDLQQAYDNLKVAQSRILQQEKMACIGQLAAGVAHEINNPIGFMLSNLNTLDKYAKRLIDFHRAQETVLAQLIARGEAEQAVFEELKECRRRLKIDAVLDDIGELVAESIEGGDRVKKIVQNLKSFARPDEDEQKPADINQCLESTLNMVWNELKYKCEVQRDFGELPPLLCNPGQLNQVFTNLLVNAAQAIESKGEIRIVTRQEGESVVVAIEDNGSGIPAEGLPRIFEPFYTTKEVGKGTGLGLSIAYDIIKNHQGDISAESGVGKGTRFTIRLPLNAEAAQEDATRD